ncbi:unnamed protein product, partial [Didymodactylos carnosus]
VKTRLDFFISTLATLHPQDEQHGNIQQETTKMTTLINHLMAMPIVLDNDDETATILSKIKRSLKKPIAVLK